MWLCGSFGFTRQVFRSLKVTKRRRPVFYAALCFAVLLIILNIQPRIEKPQTHYIMCRMEKYVPWLGDNTTMIPVMNISSLPECNISMTVVTAFFDIGPFRKGLKEKFNPAMYHEWAMTFRYLLNPLVVYTDSLKFKQHFTELRHELKESTKVIYVKRSSFWAWNIVSEIKELYSKPTYPKFHPNTVIPEYAAAQHAKYAVVSDAINENYFQTEFYSWVDLGYFRDVVDKQKYFILDPPNGFTRNRIAANVVVGRPKKDPKIKDIFYKNLFWVGGGMFFGLADVMLNFSRQYQRAVRYFLDNKLMGTDQQILYSMYSDEGRKLLKPQVELELFYPNGTVNGNTNEWFYLGYLCLKVVKFVSSTRHLQLQWSEFGNDTWS